MVLQPILDSLEGLPEDVAKEYKQDEKTKKFMLDVAKDQGFELANTKKLKKALGEERASVKSLKERVGTYGDLDPEKARDALTKVAEMASWDPEKEVSEKIEAREKQLIAKHKTEVGTVEDQLKSVTGALQKHLVTNAAMQALDAADGSQALLLPHIEKRVRMKKSGDQFIAEVYDEAGNQRIGDTEGSPMTIAQLVDEMKADEQFAPAFKGPGASGSGAGGAGAGKPSTPPPAGVKKTVSRSDQAAMNANLEGIANGSVQVVD